MIKYVKIEGIHCDHCIETITKNLLKIKNITNVQIKNNIAHIEYNNKLDNSLIIKTIIKIGYFTKEEYISDNLKELDNKLKFKEFLIIFISILLLWFLMNKIFGINIFNIIPSIDSKITYGMLFITGLLTSIHCISMCGAINLIAIIDNKTKNYKRPILYNLGRLTSYTIMGGIVGLIGSALSINESINGIIIIIASILMFLMSLKMLGIFDFKLPFSKIRIKRKTRNPFVIGLFNGIMPCGPLQSMQIYALSTGSFFKGALSMFLFCLGTIPLMLSVGLIYNLIKGKEKILINKVASILILILSIVMLNRGLLSLNIDITKPFTNYSEFTSSKLKDNYQIVEFNLNYNKYEDIILQKGVPVKMIIHVKSKYLTGCNNEIILSDFNIIKKLNVGDNIIEFTPEKTGDYTYTCWMNMIKNNIKVIDDIDYFKGDKK